MYKKNRAKWIMPLPIILEDLNKKFLGLEKSMFCLWTRGKNKIRFKEICFCIEMYSRQKFTILDMRQIYNFIPNIYSFSFSSNLNFIAKKKKLIINIINKENINLKKVKNYKQRFLRIRKNQFRRLLKNELLKQHQDYITWNNNWNDFVQVHIRKRLYPNFKINSDFKIDKMTLDFKTFRKINIEKKKIFYVKKNKTIQKRKFVFHPKKIKKKLCNFTRSLVQLITKRKYLSTFYNIKLFFPQKLKKKIIKNINPILKHLSPSILIKNQGKKISKEFLDNLNTSLKKQRLKDIIHLVEIIQSIFILNRKSSVSYDLLLKKISETNKRSLTLSNSVKYIDFLCIFFPEYYQVKKTINMKIFRFVSKSNLHQIKKRLRLRLNTFNKFCLKSFNI